MCYLINSFHFSAVISEFKHDLSRLTLNKNIIHNISKRSNFHYRNIDSILNNPSSYKSTVKVPKESCSSKLFRIVCTSYSHPYHYDFGIRCSPELAKTNVLCQIKQRYGYSRRSSSVCFQTSASSRTANSQSNSVRNNQNSIKNRLIYPMNSSSRMNEKSQYVIFTNNTTLNIKSKSDSKV